jgi:hypothetical protein
MVADELVAKGIEYELIGVIHVLFKYPYVMATCA